jgi:hypothetical protein
MDERWNILLILMPELLWAMIVTDERLSKSFLGYGHLTAEYCKRIYGNRSYVESQCTDEKLKINRCEAAKLFDFA